MKDDMALKELYGIFGSNNPDFAREGLKLVLNQKGLEKLGKRGSPHAAAAMFGITLRMAMEEGYPNETVELHQRRILHKVQAYFLDFARQNVASTEAVKRYYARVYKINKQGKFTPRFNEKRWIRIIPTCLEHLFSIRDNEDRRAERTYTITAKSLTEVNNLNEAEHEFVSKLEQLSIEGVPAPANDKYDPLSPNLIEALSLFPKMR